MEFRKELRSIASHPSVRSGAWVLAAAVALVMPALANGYPILHSDSGSHLFYATVKPIYYGLFLGTGRIGGTLWIPILLQAAVCAGLLCATGRFAFRLPVAVAARVVAVLALVSAVAYYASTMMPDVFAGCLGLACGLLVGAWNELGRWGRVALGVLIIPSALVHQTNGPVALLSVVVAVVITGTWRKGSTEQKGATLAASCIVGALGLGAAGNWIVTGTPWPKGRHDFQLASLAESGLLQEHLEAHCTSSSEPYPMWADREEVAASPHGTDFMWNPKSPFYATGGWDSEQHARLAHDILVERWPKYLRFSLLRAIGLAFSIDTLEVLPNDGLGARGFPTGVDSSATAILATIPADYLAYKASFQATRQNWGNGCFGGLNWFHKITLVLSLFFVLGALVKGTAIPPAAKMLAIISLCYIAINAVACAMTGIVTSRYQARVTWVLPAIAIMLFIHRARECADGTKPEEQPRAHMGKVPP